MSSVRVRKTHFKAPYLESPKGSSREVVPAEGSLPVAWRFLRIPDLPQRNATLMRNHSINPEQE